MSFCWFCTSDKVTFLQSCLMLPFPYNEVQVKSLLINVDTFPSITTHSSHILHLLTLIFCSIKTVHLRALWTNSVKVLHFSHMQNFLDYALSEKSHCKFLTNSAESHDSIASDEKILPQFSSQQTSYCVDTKLNNMQLKKIKQYSILPL